jgi:hypothetical protein
MNCGPPTHAADTRAQLESDARLHARKTTHDEGGLLAVLLSQTLGAVLPATGRIGLHALSTLLLADEEGGVGLVVVPPLQMSM